MIPCILFSACKTAIDRKIKSQQQKWNANTTEFTSPKFTRLNNCKHLQNHLSPNISALNDVQKVTAIVSIWIYMLK